jgi:NAD(P)-dependent dehydrogenase (short-subunit alcohol dehydrogenase family)
VNQAFDLTNRCIAITGAAGLLGREFASSLAESGANLVLIDINQIPLNQLCNDLHKRFNIRAMPIIADITDSAQVEEAASVAQREFGKISGLINNAARNPAVGRNGIINRNRIEDFEIETWNADLAVGLGGAFLCSKYFGMIMSEQEDGGVIINISSDLGLISPDQRLYRTSNTPQDQQPVKPISYSVVKTGILGLTRYLATYWPGKVRCNAICPGGVEQDQDQEFIKKISELIPMGRMARVNEYGPTMVYLMSDASSYLNGAIIPIDGGRSSW